MQKSKFQFSILFYLLFFCFAASPLESAEREKKYCLVACALFQNESFFLKEWIEYHRLIGVEHFYLYNNLSTDHYQEILEPYIKEGLVDLYEWNVEAHDQKEYLDLLQKPIYWQACQQLNGKAAWVAFIDLDEFIVPVEANDLKEFLKDFEEYGGLAINWQLFGTSGIYSLQQGELISEHLVYKADPERHLNQFIKLIVRPEYVRDIHDPHDFEFVPGKYAVDSQKNPLEKGRRGQKIILDKIRINHYWFGTLEWFLNEKIPRREKWGISFPMEQLDRMVDTYNECRDETILKFVPLLKIAMKKTL